jgi:hypothetical protein
VSVRPVRVRAAVAGLLLILVCFVAYRPAVAQVSEADVYVAEAVLAIDDKQWDKALDLLRQALARAPGHVEASTTRASPTWASGNRRPPSSR